MRAVVAVLAAIALFFGAVMGAKALGTSLRDPDPLCIRSGVIHGDPYKVCRAVANGQLVVLYFVHRQGVWFLIGAQAAANLPTGGPKS